MGCSSRSVARAHLVLAMALTTACADSGGEVVSTLRHEAGDTAQRTGASTPFSGSATGWRPRIADEIVARLSENSVPARDLAEICFNATMLDLVSVICVATGSAGCRWRAERAHASLGHGQPAGWLIA